MKKIVIVGGFLTSPKTYSNLARLLAKAPYNAIVEVSSISSSDWLSGAWDKGARMIEKIDEAVQRVCDGTRQKVTLVAHSAGGILSRIYLGDRPYRGRCCDRYEKVDTLITLGTPHKGRVAGLVNQKFPGAYCSPQVTYIALAGKSIKGKVQGSFRENVAYTIYSGLQGKGDTWGDGLVPTESAKLERAHNATLPFVTHNSYLGEHWYGSEGALKSWGGYLLQPESISKSS